MLTLLAVPSPGKYVTVARDAAPAAGGVSERRVQLHRLRVHDRRHEPDLAARTSPPARPPVREPLPNPSRPSVVADATVPPANRSGAPPSAAWNSGP